MQMGGNQNERPLDLAQRIEPVNEVSLLILALSMSLCSSWSTCPVVHTVANGMKDLKEE